MSALAQSGEPRTIVVAGDGTNSLTFTIPPGITLSVESVLAQVDASGAGGPVTATLSVLEQSGVVIANKRQGEAVDAGGPGSATWALRLADEQAASVTPSVAALEQFLQLVPTNIAPFGAAVLPWVRSSGAFLLNLFLPGTPKLFDPGVYSFNLEVVPQAGALASFNIFWTLQAGLGGVFSGRSGVSPWITPQTFNHGAQINLTREFAANDGFRVNVSHDSAVAQNFFLLGDVERLS